MLSSWYAPKLAGSRIVKNTRKYTLSPQYRLMHAEESQYRLMHAEEKITTSPEALGHAHWCSPFDTGPHMMISPPAPDTNQQMHTHVKLPIYAETCVHALSSRYWPTFKDAPSALNKCRKVPDYTHAQTNAGTLSALDTFKRMQPHPHSPQCVQTHAETSTQKYSFCHGLCITTNKPVRSFQ